MGNATKAAGSRSVKDAPRDCSGTPSLSEKSVVRKERQYTQDEQCARECMPCFVYSLREEQRAYEQRKMREWKRDSGDLSKWVSANVRRWHEGRIGSTYK